MFSSDFFVYLFLCQQHYEKTAGPICMKFSGKVWSDHGTTGFNFGSVRVNGVGRSKVKLFVITGHSSESVAFARRRGLLCPGPQLVLLNRPSFQELLQVRPGPRVEL